MKQNIPTKLEADVICAIANEAPEISNIISEQFKNRVIVENKVFPSGFYIKYEIKDNIPPIDDTESKVLGNVGAKIPDLKYGMGFALFMKDGYISSLEGYTYNEEPLPADLQKYELYYL